MILSTQHPLAERFRTDPVCRNSFLWSKVPESDTGNLGCFLVTITVMWKFLYGAIPRLPGTGPDGLDPAHASQENQPST